MTKEQYDKATEINKEIQKYGDLIARIKQGLSTKKVGDSIAKGKLKKDGGDHNAGWQLLRFFQLRLEKEKVIVMPHYEFARGIEIDAEYLRAHLPTESYYQDKIIKHIRELIPSSFVWKAAAGPYSRQGIPDICAVVNGRYYGFEVKRPFIGVLSKIQERTILQIRAAGGKAYVVTYPAEVTEILQGEVGLAGMGG